MKNALKGILNKAMSDEERFKAILALADSMTKGQTIDDQDQVNPDLVQARNPEEAFMMLVNALGKLIHIEAMVTPQLCSLIAMEAHKRSSAPINVLSDTIPPTRSLNEQLDLCWKTVEGEALALAK